MRAIAAALAAVVFLAACSTPERRIKKNQGEYDAAPPEIQAAMKEGRAAVGMTQKQAEIALGKPDRTYTRQSKDSQPQEVWAYGRGSSRPGIGFGLGVFGGGPAIYGGGVSVGPGYDNWMYEETARVVFEGGKVVSVEQRRK